MREVTDPALLSELERKPVTDEALINRLNGVEPSKADAFDPVVSLYNFMRQKQHESSNIVGGGLRGAASIGSTLIAPFTDMPRSERLNAVEGGLSELGADTNSKGFAIGKLGAEIAGTAGAGGVLSKAASSVPFVAKNAPAFIEALRTSGMSAAGAKGFPALLARTTGGAITGATQAGMIDPEDAVLGAAFGAGTPLALMAAGRAGNAVGSMFRGPRPSPSTTGAAKEAIDAGYVIPPTQVKPNLVNRLLEGFSGKLTTAQNASARNQPVTNRLVNETLGLPADTQLSHEVLNKVRKVAGDAYEVVRNAGEVVPDKSYGDALDDIVKPYLNAAKGFPNARPNPVVETIKEVRSNRFDASSAVDKIIELREQASAKYASGDKTIGRAMKRAADALEQTLDDHLVKIGAPADTLKNFRDSRQLIAKTYSVESALNTATGSVDAAKLAGQLKKGKPLSGGIKTAAEFAAQFPTASKVTEKMGSLPQLSPLDWAVGAIGAGNYVLGGEGSSPWPAALMFMRPAARYAALSGPIQRGLAAQAMPGLLSGLDWRTAVARSLPAIVADQ